MRIYIYIRCVNIHLIRYLMSQKNAAMDSISKKQKKKKSVAAMCLCEYLYISASI